MESKTPWATGASRATFQPFVNFKMSTTTSIRCGSTVTISLQSWVLCYPSNITDATGIPLDVLPIERYADIENLVRDISPPTAGCGNAEKLREQWVYLTNYGFRFRDDDPIRRVRGYHLLG